MMDDATMLQNLLRLQSNAGGNNNVHNVSNNTLNSSFSSSSNNMSNESMMDKMLGGIAPSNIETMMSMNVQQQAELKRQNSILLQQFLTQKQQRHQQQQTSNVLNTMGSNNSFSQLSNSAAGVLNAVSSGSSFASMMMGGHGSGNHNRLNNQSWNLSNSNNNDASLSSIDTSGIGGLDDMSPIPATGRSVLKVNNPFLRNFGNCNSSSSGSLRGSNNVAAAAVMQNNADILALMSSSSSASSMMNNGRMGPPPRSVPSMATINTTNPLLQKVGMVLPTATPSSFSVLQDNNSNSVSVSNSSTPNEDNENENTNNETSNASDPFANGMLAPWSAHAAGLLGTMMQDAAQQSEDDAKKSRKKPKDRPKRPLSAYNIFFKEERNRILESLPVNAAKEDDNTNSNTSDGEQTSDPENAPVKRRRRKRKGPAPHGKIGFESLAKLIGKRWQELEPDKMAIYKGKAEEDMQRYKKEMVLYKQKKSSIEAGGKMNIKGSTGSLSSIGTANSSMSGSSMMLWNIQNNTNNTSANEAMFDKNLFEPMPMQEGLSQHGRALPQQFQNDFKTCDMDMMMMSNMMQQHQQQLQQQQQQTPLWKKPRLDSTVFNLDTLNTSTVNNFGSL
mmetsp:Transcript_5746/g.9066  ORF Transcript_5746/g.9066 Transcript_5746/m.9066 type:complete len:616 (+) Transcript_5746:71-1918(+)|eukprot:CAMPEP_0178752372 /NCGR_PEP_ID=MMETSP0744-20121128/11031_1 /TAXON_ID=913974 /ORGANISM="Nitzschia punctata, Strain CCMP561" /LENGTH=615 /DNA_ID=CAMNT_0020406093 /DNA_START=139 /DNA_END=1986 /DNA_ORIENTATION=-